MRFGWQRYNEGPIYSEPFTWASDRTHRIAFHAGSLLPPEGSSVWPSTVTLSERRRMKREFGCALDGHSAWLLDEGTPDVSPSSVQIGRNTLLEFNIADTLNAEVVSVTRGSW
jgi:hypothetical protein